MFVPLHSHSEYSIADGLFSPEAWAKVYKARGFTAAALTDHGTLGGTLEFYHAMKKQGVIPILGAEFYFVDEPTLKVKENRKANHLILIAKDYDGYQNLMKLSKLSYTDGFYFKPRVGPEWIQRYHEGLVCLTACQGGVLSNEIWRTEKGEPCIGLENRFKNLHKIFGNDLYVEFQGHNTVHKDKETEEEFNSQELINSKLYELRKLSGFQPICTNDNHYILPKHSEIQALLKQMAYGNNDAGQSYTHCDSLWLKDAKQVYEAFRTHHEYLPREFVAQALKNTEAVLEKCKDFSLPKGKRYLPIFREDTDSAALFKKLTFSLLEKFIKLRTLHASKEEYVARFKTEFQVISRYKLQDYFLIVWDIVRFAEERGIFVGLGRGSSAGSLISYLLGIVKIDPLQYNLIFERFLNENRCETGELPDIDLDFESDRRDEIKEYIFKTYGRERVCEIGTYGRMMLKTSLIDFGKALEIVTSKDILAITTQLSLDKSDANSLEAAANADVRLRQLLDRHENYHFIVSQIIGQIKSQGIHPAGVIICPENVENITPVKTQKAHAKATDRILVTQAEDKQVTAQGIMKMDILGLKEYDVIKYVIENAPGVPFTRENYLEYILAQDGKPIWKMFQNGETSGVFQFASSGMQDLLRQMKPTSMNDLMAANALFRPGCLENGWHLDYCDRKHGREPVEFVHPDLEKALGDTYGVICYQEQFMDAIHRLGGISLADSDTIRSALGKKDAEKLDKFRAQFVESASIKMGAEEAQAFWEQIEKAAGYTFNRSHAAAYSVLAYVSQYLKYHYPAYFWAAQLDWDVRKNKMDEMLLNRRAASDMDVNFCMPHINESKEGFRVRDKDVLWPLRGVKGVGPKAAEEVVANQPFKDFKDFHKRVNKSKVKYNNIQALIYCGCFDEFGDRRELLRELASLCKGKRYTALSEEDMVFKFYESMGFFEQKLKRLRGFDKDCSTEEELREYDVGEFVAVGGMLTEVRSVKTKRGDAMGFATLMDLDEMIELTIFPKQWAFYRELLRSGTIVQAAGPKSGYGGKENHIEVQAMEKK